MDTKIRSFYPLIKNINFNFSKDTDQLKKLNDTKNVIINNNIKNEKKIIIIQNNSININTNLDIASDNNIIVQVDPISTYVTKIEYYDTNIYLYLIILYPYFLYL